MFVVASSSPGPLALVEAGAVLPVLVRVGAGQPVEVQAEIDSGSTISSVDQALLLSLGAPQIGSVPIATVDGSSIAPVYAATISTVDGYNLSDGLPGVLGDTLPGHTRVLIGRDILSQLALTYNGQAGTWTLQGGGAVPVASGISPFWLAVGASFLGSGMLVGVLELARELRLERKRYLAQLRQYPMGEQPKAIMQSGAR